jgi:hypothetical protein
MYRLVRRVLPKDHKVFILVLAVFAAAVKLAWAISYGRNKEESWARGQGFITIYSPDGDVTIRKDIDRKVEAGSHQCSWIKQLP